MAVGIHSARSRLDDGASGGGARPDNRLALLDQAFYEGHRAAGQREVMQVGWVYERPVDLDRLRQFQDSLSEGLLGRLIERSPLPFGRHRWVTAPRSRRLGIAAGARPRAQVCDWFDECTQLPVDPEAGPGFRIDILPLTDGSTAVSLVLSHYVIDGIGGALAVTEAVLGMPRDLGYPTPRSRTRRRAIVQDLREAVQEIPAVTRSFVAAIREARRRRDEDGRSAPSRRRTVSVCNPDEPVIAPSVWIRFAQDEWNTRAAALGGTHSTLAAAFTARLDERMRRQHGGVDGVPVLLTVNDRTTGDDARAIAVKFVRARIDTAQVTTDLSPARAAIKDALRHAQENDDDATQLVALTPFTPKRTWRQLAEYARNDPEQPAVCSNLGDTGPAAIRPDGSLCDAAFARGASQHLTRGWLDRIGSQVHVYYGTAAEMNMVTIYVCAFGPGAVSSRTDLKTLVADVSQDFGLVGTIE